MESKGWRLLAAMLRAQRKARWNALPEEVTAKASWPAFRDAVIAAIDEQANQPAPEPSSDDTPEEPPTD